MAELVTPHGCPVLVRELIEEIDFLLDGAWDRRKTFHCHELTTLRTTVVGRSRFIVRFASNVLTDGPRWKWKFNSTERTAQTTKITRSWEVLDEGDYAFVVVELVGAALFRVTVRFEQ